MAMPRSKGRSTGGKAGSEGDQALPTEGKGVEMDGEGTVGRFARSPASLEDIAAARRVEAKIHAGIKAGLAKSLLAKGLHVKVAALEAVLREPTPSPSAATQTPPMSAPPTAPTSTPAPGSPPADRARLIAALSMSTGEHGSTGLGALPPSLGGASSKQGTTGFSPAGGFLASAEPGGGWSGSPEYSSTVSGPLTTGNTFYDTLMTISIEAGLKPEFARGIARRFSHHDPDDFGQLDKILADGGVSPRVRGWIVGAWRDENTSMFERSTVRGGNGGASSDEDPVAEVRRARHQRLRDELEELELKRLRSELAGPQQPVGPSEETVRLRAEVDLLRREAEARRTSDLFDAKLAPLARQLEEIRARPQERSRTLDGVKVDLYADATSSLIRTVDRKLGESGSGQLLAKQVAQSLGPKLVRTLGAALDEGETAENVGQPDLVQAYEVLARSGGHAPRREPAMDVIPPRRAPEWSPPPQVASTGRWS